VQARQVEQARRLERQPVLGLDLEHVEQTPNPHVEIKTCHPRVVVQAQRLVCQPIERCGHAILGRVSVDGAPDGGERIDAHGFATPVLQQIHAGVVRKCSRGRRSREPAQLARQLLGQPTGEGVRVERTTGEQALPEQLFGVRFEREAQSLLVDAAELKQNLAQAGAGVSDPCLRRNARCKQDCVLGPIGTLEHQRARERLAQHVHEQLAERGARQVPGSRRRAHRDGKDGAISSASMIVKRSSHADL
jgi:hypothetical protein